MRSEKSKCIYIHYVLQLNFIDFCNFLIFPQLKIELKNHIQHVEVRDKLVRHELFIKFSATFSSNG